MPSEWTIDTLKEHFEKQFAALHEREKLRAEALTLQAAEYERRLESLNGEQARIAANQSSSVSRELWDSTEREDREWKRRADAAIADRVSRAEFQTYKEATEKALTLKAGQSLGIGATAAVMVQILSSLGVIASIVVAIFLLGHR